MQPEGAQEAPCPAAAAPATNGAWGGGPQLQTLWAPAPSLPPQRPSPLSQTSTYLGGTGAGALPSGPDPRGCGGSTTAARGGGGERRRAAAPGCYGRAGAASSAAPSWGRGRCPGREGDAAAAAGDSRLLFGSVRKVTAATRPTLNPPPRRTQGRRKEEEAGRRQGWGLAAVHFPAQHQITAASLGLPLRDAGLGAAVQPRHPQTLRSPPPGFLHLGSVPRGQLQSAETFPFPAALALVFGLFVW